MTNKTSGQIGYEAYAFTTNWKNSQGKPMPPWFDLPESIHNAWEAAAAAILDAASGESDVIEVEIIDDTETTFILPEDEDPKPKRRKS